MIKEGIIVEKISENEFWVEEILTKEKLHMAVRGKMRLYLNKLELTIGKKVYVEFSPYDPLIGRFTIYGPNGKQIDLDRKDEEKR